MAEPERRATAEGGAPKPLFYFLYIHAIGSEHTLKKFPLKSMI
jgi:hypothetical protein